MPRVADYTIIADKWTFGGEIEFTIPESFDPGSRCVLTFMIEVRTEDFDAKTTVSINGYQVWNWDFGTDDPPPQCFQEVIQTDIVRKGKNVLSFDSQNDVTFRLAVSDVVLWWQSNI